MDAIKILRQNELPNARALVLLGYFQGVIEMLGREVEEYSVPKGTSLTNTLLYILMTLSAEATINPENYDLNRAVILLEKAVRDTAL